MRELAWFTIDMVAMQQAWNEYLDAVAAADAADKALVACEEGVCRHERPRKRDGTPDMRCGCPQGWAAYNRANRAAQAVEHDHQASFWEEIGLGAHRDASPLTAVAK